MYGPREAAGLIGKSCTSRSGLDPTNKKTQIRIFFWKNLKILEASSYDQINMTEFWLEHDQKFLQRQMNRQPINKKINKTINNRT